MNVAIVGTRTFRNWNLFVRSLNVGPTEKILTGDAPGTDAMVRSLYGTSARVFKADWERYGRSAGPIRNAQMIAEADRLIAFWDGKSRGTLNAITLAKQRGIPVEIISIEEKVDK